MFDRLQSAAPRLLRTIAANFCRVVLLAGMSLAGQALAQAPAQGPSASIVQAWQSDFSSAAHALPLGGSLQVQAVELDGLGLNDLTLTRFEVFAPDVEIIVDEARVSPTLSNAYFHGAVDGIPGSLAVLTVPKAGKPRGLVQTPDGTWFIGDRQLAATEIIGQRMSDEDFAQLEPMQCSADELPSSPSSGGLIEPLGDVASPSAGGISSPSAVNYTARMALDTDYEFYALFGNQADAIAYVGDLFAYSSSIYTREVDTSLYVSYLRLWTTGAGSDPWNVTSGTANALFEFRDYWNANMGGTQRTLAHLLSGKRLGGGVAYRDVLCNPSFGYGVSASLNGDFDINSPTIVWDLNVVTHEIGHNFGSQHSHCYRGTLGQSASIDHCYGGETNSGFDVYGDLYTCHSGAATLPGLNATSGGSAGQGNGTIMSYCHLLGGGFQNISLTFGAEPSPSHPGVGHHPFGVDAWRVPTLMSDAVIARAQAAPSCLAVVGEPVTVTPSAGSGGSVEPSTPQTIVSGATAEFTVTPDAGYTRDTPVSGTCPAGGWAGNTYTTGQITADCGLSFGFTANTPDITLDRTTLNVPEGSTATFRVRLSEQPASSVTVGVARVAGDADITVQSGASLVFTTANWASYQTVTLAAAQDVDEDNGTATIWASASGLTTQALTATELDDDGAPPPASTLTNISTRGRVSTGNSVMIGGFIITGTSPKQVLIRARGPSMAGNLSGTLSDPTINLHSGQTIIATNDNWRDTQQSAIQATGLAPADNREAAILITLDPGAYTAIVRGVGGTSGIGIVEVFDIDSASTSTLTNISTRGGVGTGNDVMIGGFIITGTNPKQVLIRARGPSMAGNLSGTLSDPTVNLHSGQTIIATNDDWRDTQQSAIQATGLAPADNRESALLITLDPGPYTAIVRGVSATTGIGIVEVFEVD